LRIITYLAPSLPPALFETIARRLDAELVFEERISGPLAGDDEPFSRGDADIGFICAPSYRVLRGTVELLPALVPVDVRTGGRPVYFADVVVRADSRFRTIEDLRGARWAYNDRNSRSGWFSMLERVGTADFFGSLIHAGSHLRSLDAVADGHADAAAIDSNVLALNRRGELRVIESWGPFAIQPAIIRSAIPEERKRELAATLLAMRRDELEAFGFAGFTPVSEAAYL
jgi:ABC-type phosphate/phosphonate transport system substrate-binding protein